MHLHDSLWVYNYIETQSESSRCIKWDWDCSPNMSVKSFLPNDNLNILFCVMNWKLKQFAKINSWVVHVVPL